ncbi:metal ABC transporter solute-binding protein, Zn/Mn family [Rhodophyticola porphyridii]|uniref:metal ABC transporter solute-binding protein, Zn/Mn family n=1 Tax=Rhodophyticola porphyridii TaxID=1852017 RepID=UPI001B1C3921|nr:zinc ABC transporter substrate-binding protein [Roseicyclus sp.]MBO6626771.1 zinc ABC transporter substrate-binding protein [Roseicyclus sp.]MBO6920959.1 zinc ABC transporter substrate-binding protein [Roseicyclus sp.]
MLKHLLIVLATTLALTGPAMAQDRLDVVATTGMIADAARVVGGDAVEVRALMGPGVDPHAYRQTRSDIVAMTRADLVLWHGLFLEAQMESFFADLGQERLVVAVADGLPRDVLVAHDDYADRFDPHVWMDPDLWALVVTEVQNALTEAQPENADLFAANAAAHMGDLAALSAYADRVLASVPEPARVLLTAHDAFNYFGAAHGFEVMGIQGISTESEAGLARISDLVDLLVDRNVGAVFVESSVSDRNVRALIEGAAARGHEVIIGGELYSDAMGPDGSYEGTYLGMIDHNVTVIARALGGTAPERGMNGLLSAGM